jgi:DNA-binding transcriptional LysR family regulator
MRLPPLNALKAFEAAARLGGFARAADELHVSPGAVSRHVKLLEAHLGVPLFVRQARGLKPTGTALALLPKITTAFEMIAAASSEASGMARSLTVIASPTFANRLLVPRLPGFTGLWPEVGISVGLLLSDLTEFDVALHDCGIATLHAPLWPDGVRGARIRAEELTPLCAPSLLQPSDARLRPEDLRRHTLLHISACSEDWPSWLKRNGLPEVVDPSRGPTFETGELAIRAAVEGLGVLLMDRFLVQRELRSGDLIDLFPEAEAIDNGYFFFCAKRRWDDPLIASFRDWVLAELSQASDARR